MNLQMFLLTNTCAFWFVYFSDQLNAVSTFFLALVYVHEATAKNIFNLIEEEINKNATKL